MIEESLQKYFGYSQFRSGQREIVERILNHEEVCVVMPTGAGKSLCYQLPILMQAGYGLVISPLIALMADQVGALNAKGLRAVCVNSAKMPSEQNIALREIAEGRAKFLYVSPERFRVPGFAAFIEAHRPSLVVVDEAHCISQWGHDFRPDYQRIWSSTPVLRQLQVCAFTATATPYVRDDIREQLGRPEMEDIVTGFRRENLHFSVLTCPTKAQKYQCLEELLKTKTPTIVYVSTRKEAENLSHEYGIRMYHAGMRDQERREAQYYFQTDACPVLVATNAFGMGIDRADVRRVIHFNLPGSLEAYYQEAGRAGRDGQPAECILINSYIDKRIQEYLLEMNNPPYEVFEQLQQWLLKHAHEDGSLIWQPDVALPDLTAEKTSSAQLSVAARILERDGFVERSFVHLQDSVGCLRFSMPLSVLEATNRGQETQRQIFIYRMAKYMQMHELDLFQGTMWDLVSCTGFRLEQLERILAALKGSVLSWTFPEVEGILVLTDKGRNLPLKMDRKLLEKKAMLDRKRLNSVLDYCNCRECRQVHIVNYFGEKIGKWHCGCCDRCGSGGKTGLGRELSAGEQTAAMSILRAVQMVDGQFGRRRVIGMLRGEADSHQDLDEHPMKGCLATMGRDAVEELVRAMESAGYIGVGAGEYPCLEVTREGLNVLKDGGRLELQLYGPPVDVPFGDTLPSKGGTNRKRTRQTSGGRRRKDWSY